MWVAEVYVPYVNFHTNFQFDCSKNTKYIYNYFSNTCEISRKK